MLSSVCTSPILFLRVEQQDSCGMMKKPKPKQLSYYPSTWDKCLVTPKSFPDGASGKEPACPCRSHKRHEFDPWVGEIPWRRAWQPRPIFLSRGPWKEEPGELQSMGLQRAENRDLALMHTVMVTLSLGFPGGSDSQESACNAEDLGSTPGSGRSPGEGNGDPPQYSCLENSLDRGAWQARVRGARKELNITEQLTQAQHVLSIFSL